VRSKNFSGPIAPSSLSLATKHIVQSPFNPICYWLFTPFSFDRTAFYQKVAMTLQNNDKTKERNNAFRRGLFFVAGMAAKNHKKRPKKAKMNRQTYSLRGAIGSTTFKQTGLGELCSTPSQ
jgi:hypothetical protein